MMFLKYSLLSIIFAMATLSCAHIESQPEVVKLTSEKELYHSLPSGFDLKFSAANKMVDEYHYYFEAARWISPNGLKEVTSQYVYLFDPYVYSDNSVVKAHEAVKSEYEDRLVSTGNEIFLTPKKKENFYFSPQRSYGSYLVFTLEDASCFYFQRFISVGPPTFDSIGGFDGAAYLGDAQIISFYCDYSDQVLTDESIRAFITGIETRIVKI